MSAHPCPMPGRAPSAVLSRGGRAQLTVSPRTPEWALREIRRCHGDVEVAQVEDEALETLLTAAYSHAEDAASVMGVAENEIDLDRLLRTCPRWPTCWRPRTTRPSSA